MEISSVKVMTCTVIGMVGGFLANMFGGWSDDMITLIVFMAVDFVMGLIVAGIFKNSGKSKSGALESKAGWKGVCRKCVTLLFVLIAHRLDVSLGLNYIRTAAIVGFIANEAISIVENAGLMGVPLPQAIVKAIEILKNRSNGGGKE